MKIRIVLSVDTAAVDNQTNRAALVAHFVDHVGTTQRTPGAAFEWLGKALTHYNDAISLDQSEAVRGWTAGYNQPGYLPDADPQTFDTFEEALQDLVLELERGRDCRVDDVGDDETQIMAVTNLYDSAIERARTIAKENPGKPFHVSVGNYVWWVTQEK